jgi:hypothetical protein
MLYCDVESKWKNYHIITFPGQSLSKNRKLSLEETMDLSRDRLILELEYLMTLCHFMGTSLRHPDNLTLRFCGYCIFFIALEIYYCIE